MRQWLIAALLVAALPAAAHAVDPEFNPDDGPVKIVVGLQPGGIGDTVARLFSDAVQKRLNQRVVVESRSGANGMITFESAAKGKTDGIALVQCTTGPMGVSPVLPGLVLPIDIIGDLQPVAGFVQANWSIAVPKDSPCKTLADLIADAKKKPGILNYGHSGISPQFPGAPQASATVPGYAVTGWVDACGPRGLPASAIRWWEKATEAALTGPNLQERLPDFGLTSGYEGAETFGKTITAEQARWKAVIDAINIRAE